MKRIDTSTRAIDLFGAGKDGFKDGNLALGIAPTDFNALWANGVQEEIINVIEAAGLAPSGSSLAQLLQAIRAITTGRLLNVQVLFASGTYVRTPGAVSGLIKMCGGGSGGMASATTTASQVSAGTGGGSGAYLEHFMSSLPATQPYTIGAAGTGGTGANGIGGAGGTTQFGGLICAGAPVTGSAFAAAPPWIVTGAVGAAKPTTGNILNLSGQQGGSSQAVALGAFLTGKGGDSPFGGGGQVLGTTTTTGFGALGPGAGGGGGICGPSTAGQQGGPGGAGQIIVIEFGGT